MQARAAAAQESRQFLGRVHGARNTDPRHLLGRTPSQVAIAWTLRNPGVTSPIVGARTAAQLEDNLGALDIEFDAEQIDRLERATAVDLGFPHEFLARPMVRSVTFGDVKIEERV
ncbi:Aldo/keto reductase family protein [Nocardia amikacinitolerans]|uniref:aldo/keto reductase n=1 Tax=Nocardia amikacinitolerans TaxID=756689 RepID=UPI0008313362|nr:aldo/keto reductase [Nocardia amikacinitolerans]MCP2318799.1 Aldo/keto reductase family protein [Nocardia amikacinitolerans]